jgi:hypothetical protein
MVKKYEYQGAIHIDPQKKGATVSSNGALGETCLDVFGLNVKLGLYSNPITREENSFGGEICKNILKENNFEEVPFFLSFANYVAEFIQSIELFNKVTEYFWSPKRENSLIINKDNLQIWCDWDDEIAIHNVHYSFNRGKSGRFPVTEQFMAFLRQGAQGKKFAENLKKYTAAEENKLWAPAEEHEERPLWLYILLHAFAKDRYLKQDKIKDHHRAIPRENFDKGLKRLFQTPQPLITVGVNKVDYHKKDDGKSLGFIPIDMQSFPNAHPSRIPIIKAGGELFNSFMSHKLLNWENKVFYERWKDEKIRLKENYARVSVKGGYKELVKILGSYPDGESIDKLRKIIYFQAHFLFTIPEDDGGCRIGNLIALEEKVNKFGQVGELKITAGSMLTPDAVFSCGVRDFGRLLVPFVSLPEKMIGHKPTWGAQAFLQMLILEYITIQSREFAKNGAVIISAEQWETLAIDAGLPSNFIGRLNEIMALFCCPDQGFLDVQGQEYSFNKKNEKAKKHLIEQGKMREKRANQAKRVKPKKKK